MLRRLFAVIFVSCMSHIWAIQWDDLEKDLVEQKWTLQNVFRDVQLSPLVQNSKKYLIEEGGKRSSDDIILDSFLKGCMSEGEVLDLTDENHKRRRACMADFILRLYAGQVQGYSFGDNVDAKKNPNKLTKIGNILQQCFLDYIPALSESPVKVLSWLKDLYSQNRGQSEKIDTHLHHCLQLFRGTLLEKGQISFSNLLTVFADHGPYVNNDEEEAILSMMLDMNKDINPIQKELLKLTPYEDRADKSHPFFDLKNFPNGLSNVVDALRMYRKTAIFFHNLHMDACMDAHTFSYDASGLLGFLRKYKNKNPNDFLEMARKIMGVTDKKSTARKRQVAMVFFGLLDVEHDLVQACEVMQALNMSKICDDEFDFVMKYIYAEQHGKGNWTLCNKNILKILTDIFEGELTENLQDIKFKYTERLKKGPYFEAIKKIILAKGKPFMIMAFEDLKDWYSSLAILQNALSKDIKDMGYCFNTILRDFLYCPNDQRLVFANEIKDDDSYKVIQKISEVKEKYGVKYK